MNDAGIRIPRWVSVVLVFGTLGLAVWLVLRDISALSALRQVGITDLAVIMILQLLQLIPESYRQKIVIESSASASMPWFPWFRIFTVGRFLNTLIPQSGNVYRALRLRSEFAISFADFGGGMIAFVIMSFVASMFVAAPFIAWQSPSLAIGGIPAPAALILIGITAATVPLLIWLVERNHPAKWRETSRVVDIAHRVVIAAITALSSFRLMAIFAGVWSLTLVIVVALYQMVFVSIGSNLGIGEAIAIYALLQASTFVVLTPGNLGIQELGLAALAALFGIPAAVGVVAASVIRLTGWLALALPAAVFGSGDIVQFFRRGDQPT